VHDSSLETDQVSENRIDEWVSDWRLRFIAKADEELAELVISGWDTPIVMRHAELLKAEHVARRVLIDTGGKVVLDRSFPYWNWGLIWHGGRNDRSGKRGITRGLLEFLMSRCDVESANARDRGLADQLEDLILSLAGCNRESVTEAIEIALGRGLTINERLKVDHRGGGLITIRAPEDPLTGWYIDAGQMALFVKLDEVTKKYRNAYGSGVANRLIVDALEELGLEREKIRRGPMEGRWFTKRKFE
jgi:hypothetical protein